MNATTISAFQSLETPFYYYDKSLLQSTLKTIQDEVSQYDDFHVHYAIKANANPQLLPLIAQAGLGADCVSGGEIQRALEAHFPANQIVFAGVGKTDKEILLALEHDIFSFNVESIPELLVINELAQQVNKIANVCLRINPNVGAHTHTHIVTGLAENKFGIDLSDMLEAVKMAQSLSHIHFKGIHVHIGSQILQMNDYIDQCKAINNMLHWLEQNNIVPEVINVGGGLGIDYQQPERNPIANFKDYFALYAKHLKRKAGQSVHFELGRSVVAQCGALITRVLYVKQNYMHGHVQSSLTTLYPSASIVKQFVIVDAGMTELIRPALYQAHHVIVNLTSISPILQNYDVVGPICESSDVFASSIALPTTQRGDLIAILSAGAYGETMASCYNCRTLPRTYVF